MSSQILVLTKFCRMYLLHFGFVVSCSKKQKLYLTLFYLRITDSCFFFWWHILFFCLCRWTGTTVLKLQHYAKKKREKPSKKFCSNITDQCFQHERQTEKKGAFENFKKKFFFTVLQCIIRSFTVDAADVALHTFTYICLTVPFCFKRTSRCLNLSSSKRCVVSG